MKIINLKLLVTVFLFWLTIQLNFVYEDVLAYLIIVTIGIVHGSNDLSIISHLNKNKNKLNSSNFLFLYVTIVLAVTYSFMTIPSLALFTFLMFSFYHFGEQHLGGLLLNNTLKSKLFFSTYGALIFALIFYCNTPDTINIIKELTGISIPEYYFLYFLVASLFSTLLSYLINLKNTNFKFNIFYELFIIVLFSFLFSISTLLWSFAIYFIIWHSIPSIIDQIKVLHRTLTKQHVIHYLKSSFLYWFISIVGLVVLYYYSTYLEIAFNTLFFAFLAAITIPHVIIMYVLNKKLK